MLYTRYGSKVEVVGKLLDIEGQVRLARCKRDDDSTVDVWPWDLRSDRDALEVVRAIKAAPAVPDAEATP